MGDSSLECAKKNGTFIHGGVGPRKRCSLCLSVYMLMTLIMCRGKIDVVGFGVVRCFGRR